MKGIVTILIVLSTSLCVEAQVKSQSPESKAQHVLDSTKLKINTGVQKVKGVSRGAKSKVDSLKQNLISPTENATSESEVSQDPRKEDAARIKLHAQQADHKYDSIMKLNGSKRRVNTANDVEKEFDGATDKLSDYTQLPGDKIDSVSQKLNGGIKNKLSVVDSTNQKIEDAQQKILNSPKKYTDSLGLAVKNIEQKLQANKLTRTIDSLKNIGQPVEKYTSKLDSIQNLNPLDKVNSGISQAQSKVDGLTSKPTSAINEKLNLLSKESGSRGNMPTNANMPNADLKGLTGNLTGDAGNMNLKGDVPSLDQSALNKNDLNLNTDLSSNTDLTKNLNVPKLDGVNDITKGAEDLTKVSGKVTGYTEDVKNIQSGNVDKVKTLKEDAIANLPVSEELTELQKQDKLFKEQQEKVKALRNPDAYKKQTLARSNEVIAKQMAVYEKQIQQSMNKVSKYQAKAGTILSLTSDLPKKRDALKRLKLYEKFVPGLTFQIQKPGAWLVDINPSVRYRLTSYWSVGTGWNERVVLGNYALSAREARVFGVRSFTEVVIFKGFSMRLDAESMNTFVIPRNQTRDVGMREWIWSYMAGIKKEFSFVPRVLGNVQFMYNVYSSCSDSPYPTRLNVRFGFEPVIKKKKK